jgi:predicted metal-dependent phosphotriesterase family hydrolase
MLKTFIPMLKFQGFDENFALAVFKENPAAAFSRFDKARSDSHNQCVNEN